jgi:hypothetical protein
MGEEVKNFNEYLKNNIFELSEYEINEKLIDFLKNTNNITHLDLGSKFFYVKNRLPYGL